jgi:hypothetical protein
MPQNRNTGAAANLWGRHTARRIMAAIGARPVNGNSNECLWKGRRFVIKSANPGVARVGLSYKMIEHLHAVLAAFRKSGSTFELYELDPKICSDNMTPTRSKGPSKGRVGMVRRAVFIEQGKALGEIALK